MTQHSWHSWLRQGSLKGLDMATDAKILGTIPDLSGDVPTFYVLRTYSRTNSLLLDLMTQKHTLPKAIDWVNVGEQAERAGVIFLQSKRKTQSPSPRLKRLLRAKCQVRLVPVTILWGRLPDKEESVFKLLFNDQWQDPSLIKQLFNIGVMGRDTFVQFHKPILLSDLVTIHEDKSGDALANAIANDLYTFLNQKRVGILGPDLSDRRTQVQRVLSADKVREAADAHARRQGISQEDALALAARYVHEMASDYSYSIVRVLDKFLSHLWTRLYDGVHVTGLDTVKAQEGVQVIYVPCHRSHVDYLLLSYVIHQGGLRMPNVAAGDNLNIPVMGSVLRAGGAFFMRRSFGGNRLYTAVFKEYFHTLMQRNMPLEYFIEGGRSRTGKMLAPKFGMLAMTVQSHLRAKEQGDAKAVKFIPTYIGYERIIEGATYVGELAGAPKRSENLLDLIKTAIHLNKEFGEVHLNFGTPIDLDVLLEECKVSDVGDYDTPSASISTAVETLGVRITQSINANASITPICLLALTLLQAPSMVMDKTQAQGYLSFYRDLGKMAGAYFITDMPPSPILEYAQKLGYVRFASHILGDLVTVTPSWVAQLHYFQNNVLHLYSLHALVALLMVRQDFMEIKALDAWVGLWHPFLRREFFLAEDALNKVAHILADLERLGLVSVQNTRVVAPRRNTQGAGMLHHLASLMNPSFLRYALTLSILDGQGKGKISRNALAYLGHTLGERLNHLSHQNAPDCFLMGLFFEFIDTLEQLGYVWVEDGRLTFDSGLETLARSSRAVLPTQWLALIDDVAGLKEDDLAQILATAPKKYRSRR